MNNIENIKSESKSKSSLLVIGFFIFNVFKKLGITFINIFYKALNYEKKYEFNVNSKYNLSNEEMMNLKQGGFSIFFVAILLTIFEIGFFYLILIPITEKEKNESIFEIGKYIANSFNKLKKEKKNKLERIKNNFNTNDFSIIKNNLPLINFIINDFTSKIDEFELPDKLSLIETLDYRETLLTKKINLYVFISGIIIIIILFIFLNKLVKSIKNNIGINNNNKENFTGSKFLSLVTILIICIFQLFFFKLSKKYLYTIYGLKSLKIKDIEDFIYIENLGKIDDNNIKKAKKYIFKKYINDNYKIKIKKLPDDLQNKLKEYNNNDTLSIYLDTHLHLNYDLEKVNNSYKRKYDIGSYISRNINEACIDYIINTKLNININKLENYKKRLRYDIYSKKSKQELTDYISSDSFVNELSDDYKLEIIKYINNDISRIDLIAKINKSMKHLNNNNDIITKLTDFIEKPYENIDNLSIINNDLINYDLINYLNSQDLNQNPAPSSTVNILIENNHKEIIKALIYDNYYKFDESYKFGNGDNETEILLFNEIKNNLN